MKLPWCVGLAGIGTLPPGRIGLCLGARKQRGARDLSQEIDFAALRILGVGYTTHQSGEVRRVGFVSAATAFPTAQPEPSAPSSTAAVRNWPYC